MILKLGPCPTFRQPRPWADFDECEGQDLRVQALTTAKCSSLAKVEKLGDGSTYYDTTLKVHLLTVCIRISQEGIVLWYTSSSVITAMCRTAPLE